MSTKEELKEQIKVLQEQLRDQRDLNEFHRRINGELNEELEAEKAKRKCLCDDDQ
tara:strand:+ start:771 stop:935 length:165 start_codon:yes stop_codon:yes gene_type:complete